jgi:glucose-1-phosphate adenylyltransferase
VLAYFKHSFDLLNPFISKGFFENGLPLYTKIHDEVPAKYSESARVKNCMVADG